MTEVFVIQTDLDIVPARQRVRELAAGLGLAHAAVEGVATALTEVARNIVVHAGGTGSVAMSIEKEAGRRRSLVIVASDRGPGIADLDRALQDGFSTAGGLGLGLPGARRLVDELVITSAPGSGTTVTMRVHERTQESS